MLPNKTVPTNIQEGIPASGSREKHRIAVYLDAINHIETALIVIFPFGADHSDFVPSFPQRLSQVPHPSVEWERTVLQQHKHSGGY